MFNKSRILKFFSAFSFLNYDHDDIDQCTNPNDNDSSISDDEDIYNRTQTPLNQTAMTEVPADYSPDITATNTQSAATNAQDTATKNIQATNARDAATNTENTATNTENTATNTQNTATNTQNTATNTQNAATNTHDAATHARITATNPQTTATTDKEVFFDSVEELPMSKIRNDGNLQTLTKLNTQYNCGTKRKASEIPSDNNHDDEALPSRKRVVKFRRTDSGEDIVQEFLIEPVFNTHVRRLITLPLICPPAIDAAKEDMNSSSKEESIGSKRKRALADLTGKEGRPNKVRKIQ